MAVCVALWAESARAAVACTTCSGMYCGECSTGTCIPGYYCDYDGSNFAGSSCTNSSKLCWAGYFCPAGSKSSCGMPTTAATGCPIGTECKCGVGTWSSAGSGAQSDCKTTHTSCSAGKYANGNGGIVDVSSGYYSAEGNCAQTLNTASNCSALSTTDNKCTSCKAGFGWAESPAGSGNGTCTACTGNDYSTGGTMACTPNTATGCHTKSNTANECASCSAGRRLISGACSMCGSGTWSSDGNTAATCPATNSACTAGNWADGTGIVAVSSGYFSPAGDCTQTQNTATGCSIPSPTANECRACDSGFGWASTSGTNGTCTACADGRYGGGATTACLLCSALPTTGQSPTGGTYSSVDPRWDATDCRYKAPNKSITGCASVTQSLEPWDGSKWSATTYSVLANAGYVIANNNTAAATCNACGSGTYMSATSHANTVCSECNALGTPPHTVTGLSGGTYSSVNSPYDNPNKCRFTLPLKSTPANCAGINQPTIAYSGTAWSTTYYTVTANPGYRIENSPSVNPTCEICQKGTWNNTPSSPTCAACSPAPTNTNGGVNAGFEWTEEGQSVQACPYKILSCAKDYYLFNSGPGCSLCDVNKNICKACNPSFESPAGSTAETACVRDCSVPCSCPVSPPVISPATGVCAGGGAQPGKQNQTQGTDCYDSAGQLITASICTVTTCNDGYFKQPLPPWCLGCPSRTTTDTGADDISLCYIPTGAMFRDNNNQPFNFGTGFSGGNKCYYNP